MRRTSPRRPPFRYDHELPEDAGAVSHAHAIEKIGSDGSTLRIDVELIATEPLADSAWDEVDAWLDETVDGAIQGIAADTESLAHVVDEAIADAQRDARRAQSDSPWASEALLVEAVTVTLPYYPELERRRQRRGDAAPCRKRSCVWAISTTMRRLLWSQHAGRRRVAGGICPRA